MYIDRQKNNDYTLSAVDLPHLVEKAYKRGIYEFYNGVHKEVEPTPEQAALLNLRALAIAEGDEAKVDKATNALLKSGVFLKETREGDKLVETKLIHVVLASNPYNNPESLYHKEWQRGFDTGYLRHQQNVINMENKRKNGNFKEKAGKRKR